MKKVLLAAICLVGFQSVTFAQESESVVVTKSKDTIPGINLYASFGASFSGDYKLNDKLSAQGLPKMADVQPEFTVGFNVRATKKFWMDVEVFSSYSDEKNAIDRVKSVGFGGRLRPQYVAFNTKGFFGTVGADISYFGNQVDIYSRSNQIDLNNLNPSLHSGHISLRNELMYAGPSLSFGFLQNTGFPLRLNLGYEWAITNGKWKSDFADVNNNVKEAGHNRAYAKITIGL